MFLCLTVADPLDHATGLEKREMLAHIAGNDVSHYILNLTDIKNISLWI
jgi:hypothetical protein